MQKHVSDIFSLVGLGDELAESDRFGKSSEVLHVIAGKLAEWPPDDFQSFSKIIHPRGSYSPDDDQRKAAEYLATKIRLPLLPDVAVKLRERFP